MMTRKLASSVVRWCAAVLCATAIGPCAVSAFGQEPACKSKGGEVKVEYPALARKMKISGTVRLHLQLSSSGGVRDTKVLGGNPVLASAAQEAVKQAKFEGAEPCIAVFEFKQ